MEGTRADDTPNIPPDPFGFLPASRELAFRRPACYMALAVDIAAGAVNAAASTAFPSSS
jgi:hypothetical protein